MTRKIDWISAAAMVLMILVWGASFMLIALALKGFHPQFIVFARLVLAATPLLIIAASTKAGLPKGREWLYCALLGIINLVVPFNLITWAQIKLDSGLVAIFIAAVPLATLLFARLLAGAQVTALRWLGFGIGLIGLIGLIGPSALTGLGAVGTLWQQLALVAAACSFGAASVILSLLPKMNPVRATAGTMTMGAVFMAPIGLSAFEGFTSLHLSTPLLALISLGVLQTGLAQLLRFTVINRVGPVVFSIGGYFIPVWAAILGYLVLDEILGWRELASFAVILTGVTIAQFAAPASAPASSRG